VSYLPGALELVSDDKVPIPCLDLHVPSPTRPSAHAATKFRLQTAMTFPFRNLHTVLLWFLVIVMMRLTSHSLRLLLVPPKLPFSLFALSLPPGWWSWSMSSGVWLASLLLSLRCLCVSHPMWLSVLGVANLLVDRCKAQPGRTSS
jgi:hypothetical protein